MSGRWLSPKNNSSWEIIQGKLGETVTNQDLVFFDTVPVESYPVDLLSYGGSSADIVKSGSLIIFQNEMYLAYTYEDGNFGVAFKKWTGSGWIDSDQLDWFPSSGKFWDIDLHIHNGTMFVAFGCENSPRLSTEWYCPYLVCGQPWNLIDDPVPLPGVGNDVISTSMASFGDELFLSATSNTAPYIYLYKFNFDPYIWEPISAPTGDLNSSVGYRAKLHASPSNLHLVITGNEGHPNYVKVRGYVRSGTTWVGNEPTPTPTLDSYFSDMDEFAGETYLAVNNVSDTEPFHIYKHNGTEFDKMANPSTFPLSNYGYNIAIKSFADTIIVAMSLLVSPWLIVYRLSAGVWIEVPGPSGGDVPDILYGQSVTMEVLNDELFLVLTSTAASQANTTATYKIATGGAQWQLTQVAFTDNIGVAQSSGVADDLINIISLK